jgi:type IV pilus biogenesis protein CpaD/CtpE
MSMRVTLGKIHIKRMVLCAMALLAAGCARQPDQIAPSPVATDRYLPMSCADLLASRAGKKAEQARLEQAQHEAAERDKAAMGVIHIPVASMAGQDREDEVARGKGELAAIDAAIQSKGCE